MLVIGDFNWKIIKVKVAINLRNEASSSVVQDETLNINQTEQISCQIITREKFTTKFRQIGKP